MLWDEKSLLKGKTPIALIGSARPKASLFDLLLLFEDCIESADTSSDGWELVRTLCNNPEGPYVPTVLRNCHSLLLQRYRAHGTDMISLPAGTNRGLQTGRL
jgi:hypothetical protein